MVANWYATLGADDSCLQARPDNLRYYGQSVDNLAAAINAVFNIKNEYTTRHFVGALVGFFLLILTGKLTHYLTGNYVIATLSMIALFISPRPFGQALGNLKDIPYALGYIWATFGTIKFIKEMPVPTLKTTLFLAGGIAFSNSVRIGGILSFLILGFFVLVWILLNYKQSPINHLLSINRKHYTFLILILIVVGYLGGLLFWPYGLQNPILNPIKALSLMSHYAISIRQIFEGEYYWSTHLPWHYVLVWLLISIPEFVWISLLLFGFFLATNWTKIFKNQNRLLPISILLFGVLFPLIYVIIIKSNLYSGWRQLYFIYPLMIVIGSVGVFEVWKKYRQKFIRYSLIGILTVTASFPVWHIFQTFPNHYIYFNKLAGGTEKNWSNYEYDYYFHGMKESCDWFFENIEIPAGSTIASNLDVSPYFPKGKKLKYKYVHFYEYHKQEWDYAILSNNYVHPYQLKNEKWMPNGVIKTIFHNKNPYIVVLKWDGNEAITGQKAFDKGLYYAAAKHLEIAIEKDRNNNHLKALLGMSYFYEGRFHEAKTVIDEGLRYNPYNEPLRFLKAKVNFAEGNYPQAMDDLKELIHLNSKYKAAYPLLADCYDKLGMTNKSQNIRKQLK